MRGNRSIDDGQHSLACVVVQVCLRDSGTQCLQTFCYQFGFSSRLASAAAISPVISLIHPLPTRQFSFADVQQRRAHSPRVG